MSWFDQMAPSGTGTFGGQDTHDWRGINDPRYSPGGVFYNPATDQGAYGSDPRLPTAQAPMAGRAPYNPNLPLDQQPGYPGGGATTGQGMDERTGIPWPGGIPPAGSLTGTLPSDPQQAFLAAAAALGIPPNQTRGRSTEIVAYLTSHGQPGWQAGGTQADDWVKTPQGQGIDYSAAGSNAFQWNNDNTGAGGGSMGALGGMYQGGPFSMPSASEFQQSPGYQFARDQGLQAIQRSAAARGTLLTGGTLKALDQYGTGVANQDYNNYFNRAYQTNQGNFNNQFSLANLGATTARNG